jgi:hypothetical protein
VILASPLATAVTIPEVLTRATAVFELAHETVAPAIVPPDPSLTVALSCLVALAVRLVEAGLTVTDPTVGVPPPPPPLLPIVTAEVSAKPVPWSVAITRYVPGVCPAVNLPQSEIVPPVAVYLGSTENEEPSLTFPARE